jgi:chemotaxis signal transduction protein
MKKKAQIQFLCFKLGEYFFGLDVMNVEEIVNFKGAEIPPVVGGEGFIKYKDRQLKIYYPDEILLNGPIAASVDYRLIVVESERRQIGLVVDSAEEIIRVTADEIREVEIAGTDVRRDNLYGQIVQERKIVRLIDLAKMISAITVH